MGSHWVIVCCPTHRGEPGQDILDIVQLCLRSLHLDGGRWRGARGLPGTVHGARGRAVAPLALTPDVLAITVGKCGAPRFPVIRVHKDAAGVGDVLVGEGEAA